MYSPSAAVAGAAMVTEATAAPPEVVAEAAVEAGRLLEAAVAGVAVAAPPFAVAVVVVAAPPSAVAVVVVAAPPSAVAVVVVAAPPSAVAVVARPFAVAVLAGREAALLLEVVAATEGRQFAAAAKRKARSVAALLPRSPPSGSSRMAIRR